jgi:hypothetical protein
LAGCRILDAKFKVCESINNGFFRFVSELNINFIIWMCPILYPGYVAYGHMCVSYVGRKGITIVIGR